MRAGPLMPRPPIKSRVPHVPVAPNNPGVLRVPVVLRVADVPGRTCRAFRS